MLSKVCNVLLFNVRINWKYTTHGHFAVGDGLTTTFMGATSPHLVSFVVVVVVVNKAVV